ncbi:hypothetical protein GBA52_009942, partial [Prunus armeniaca]
WAPLVGVLLTASASLKARRKTNSFFVISQTGSKVDDVSTLMHGSKMFKIWVVRDVGCRWRQGLVGGGQRCWFDF